MENDNNDLGGDNLITINATMSQMIKIGHQGENKAVQVAFDLTPFQAEYQGGYPQLVVRRPGDHSGYPVALIVNGSQAIWIVSASDTEKSGHGQCELQWFVGDTLAKSDKYNVLIYSSIPGDADPPDAPSKAWFEKILSDIGDLSDLDTESKENLVAAINEARQTGGGGAGGTNDHSKLSNRDAADQHPIGAITGLEVALAGKQPVGSYLTEESDPTVPAWAKADKKPSYTAQEVGADPSGTAAGLVSAHNTAEAAHNDIRLLISGLTDRLNALADSDDTTLDQLSEVVAYIKSNRTLIEAITTSKVSVSDIIDNLTTNASNKPLSAAQGVALKALIDAITIPTALPNPNALTFTGAATGSYDGSEAKTINIPIGSGGGGSISLPLLYDLTTTEEVSWIDTGDNAYTVNSFLVVELVSIATTSNEADGDGSASMYPIQSGGLQTPWVNFVIENKISALLPKTYDKVFRAFCFRGEDGHWSSITAIRNDVNPSYTTPRMITVRNDGVSNQPMRGLIIGKSWQAKSNVLGVGSRLRVWGI